MTTRTPPARSRPVPLWLGGLAGLVLTVLAAGMLWALAIGLENFSRIGV